MQPQEGSSGQSNGIPAESLRVAEEPGLQEQTLSECPGSSHLVLMCLLLYVYKRLWLCFFYCSTLIKKKKKTLSWNPLDLLLMN